MDETKTSRNHKTYTHANEVSIAVVVSTHTRTQKINKIK